MFQLSFAGVVIRFYLMMAVVLVAGFTGLWWLAILALPIFLSAMVAYKPNSKKVKSEAKMVKITSEEKRQAI